MVDRFRRLMDESQGWHGRSITWRLLCRNKLMLNQPLAARLVQFSFTGGLQLNAIYSTGVKCLHEASGYDCADRGRGCAPGLCAAVRITQWLFGPLLIGISLRASDLPLPAAFAGTHSSSAYRSIRGSRSTRGPRYPVASPLDRALAHPIPGPGTTAGHTYRFMERECRYGYPGLIGGYPYGYGDSMGSDDSQASAECCSRWKRCPAAALQPPALEPSQPSAGISQQSQAPGSQDAVTIIFKDGRPPEQIHNYLLTRTTLYVNDSYRHDIPTSQLDLIATAKVNHDAGVDFSLPDATQ